MEEWHDNSIQLDMLLRRENEGIHQLSAHTEIDFEPSLRISFHVLTAVPWSKK